MGIFFNHQEYVTSDAIPLRHGSRYFHGKPERDACLLRLTDGLIALLEFYLFPRISVF
jgi:hypothetical protein